MIACDDEYQKTVDRLKAATHVAHGNVIGTSRRGGKSASWKSPGRTSWSVDYLYRKTGGGRQYHEWGSAKRRELEESTGVRWSGHTSHGRMVFLPYPDLRSGEVVEEAELGQRAVELLCQGKHTSLGTACTYLSLAESLGLDLRTTLGIGISLIHRNLAMPQVDRMAKPVAIYAIKPTNGEI